MKRLISEKKGNLFTKDGWRKNKECRLCADRNRAEKEDGENKRQAIEW